MDNKNVSDTEQHAGTARPRLRQKKMLAPLIAILALVVATNSLYLAWFMYQENASYATSILLLKQQQIATSNKLHDNIQNIDNLEKKLQTRIKELNDNLHKALKERLYQQQDWILLKARHYLELAQVNQHWSADNKASIALLQQADTLLKDISDQRVFQVRQTIAAEISRLQATPVVDVAGLLSKLDAAQSSVATLPIQSAALNHIPNDAAPGNNASPASWRSKLRDNINMLEKLVVIKHNDEDIKPLLSPLYQAILRESIRMNLQEAQWAILQNNTTVYQHSLQQALNDINRSFDSQASQTQALIKHLQSLQQQTLNSERPSITESLTQLNQIIDSGRTGEKRP